MIRLTKGGATVNVYEDAAARLTADGWVEAPLEGATAAADGDTAPKPAEAPGGPAQADEPPAGKAPAEEPAPAKEPAPKPRRRRTTTKE